MKRNRIFDSFLVAVLVSTIASLEAAAHAQTFSVVYNFGNVIEDPQNPWNPGIIAQGRDGSLYTTSTKGGQYTQEGTAFNIKPSGQVTLMYSFGGYLISGEGSAPTSGLALGTDGNFYGAAYQGGAYDQGTVFKITPGSALTQLHDFTGGADGASPLAGPIQGADGNWYGTTWGGGANKLGSVYKVTPAGKFTALHSLAIGEGNGIAAPLILGTDNNLYGTTTAGGAHGCGTAFKITPAGKFTVLANFGCTNGTSPYGQLVQGHDSNFYGTTFSGGSNGSGVVFKMTPAGKITVLHNFSGSPDGSYPVAGLIQATDGNLYGVAPSGGSSGDYGTIYKISSAGTFSVVYTFDLTTGATPATLMQHTNGLLYGDASGGGTGSGITCGTTTCGTFYSLDIGSEPFVSFLPQQSAGKIGVSIGIVGQGFTGATGVSFGGTPAACTISSDTYLAATVPAGALSGPVTVATAGGNLTSNRTFRVSPQIKSLSAASGPVGTPVQITGVSLTQTNRVTFGGVKATAFTVNSDTQITATVPAGAKTGRIAITTAGGTAVSAVFTVTP
jgi:uncharacterized repeat protein (TIGR03803 family)